MEQFRFEPVELTDAELHAVAGGDGTAAAAAGDGTNVATGASGNANLTFGSLTVTADHIAFALNAS